MIIQFTHPGKELEIEHKSKKNGHSYVFNTSSTGFRFWNNENDHKRKFLKHQGWYLENINRISFDPIPKKDELCFWGEWESQSEFELTYNPYSTQPSLPHAVHKALFSTRGIGRHNTDPFVFGEHFYYTNCKQKQTGIGKKLLNLPSLSIILFGSEKNKTDFVIDTLFVVDKSETFVSYKTHPTIYPKILREATLDLNGGLSNWHNLYKGKMYDFIKHYTSEEPYTFCFFPCKVDCDIKGFERPIIDWKKFGLQKPGAYTVLKEINITSETNIWNNIVNEIIRQGFSLGIMLEMPKNNDKIEFSENEETKKKC
jgi:hypothetical protein